MSTIVSPARSGTSAPWRTSYRPTRGINWLKCAPFIGLHVACLAAFLTGVNATALVLCGLTYFLRMFGITAGYHRYFSHRSYKTSRLGQFVLACLGCSALQKGPLWWAAHHREHHRHSDRPGDPHSPRETNFWWSHVGWILSSEYDETPSEEVRDWSAFPELRWLDRYHWLPGVLLAGLCLLIGGWAGLVWGFVISTVLVYHATFAINSLSHLIGTRRYQTDDDSRNNLFLAIITLGEGWHNNHHHFRSSANQGFYWWEIDISYSILRLLQLVGLVWDVRTPGAKALAHRLIRAQRPAAPAVQQSPHLSSRLDGVAPAIFPNTEAKGEK